VKAIKVTINFSNRFFSITLRSYSQTNLGTL